MPKPKRCGIATKRIFMDLVIMAAGMGSRFGGLKQIEPVNENNEFIIDYSIYDAIRAGFDRVIFIIKKENYEIFRNTVGKRVEDKIQVEYVFQELENLPYGYTVPEGRVKPWGTGHAIWCCKNVVKDDFAIVNADDFYGLDAYLTASRFIQSNSGLDFGLVAYKVKNTLSENGAAKRGVCKTANGKLIDIIESSIEKIDGEIYATPLDYDTSFIVDEDQVVSMNMWCFTPKIFKVLDREFPRFLATAIEENPLKAEFLLPTVVDKMVKNGAIDVQVKPTNAKWLGVTYKEDKESVVNGLKELTEHKIYPKSLWDGTTTNVD